MQTPTHTQAGQTASLAGMRVALAWGADEAHTPAAELQDLGAEVVYYPCLERLPPADLTALDQALDQALAGVYTWLLLPSASAVLTLSERCDQRQIAPARLTQAVRLALFGATTRLAAQTALGVDLQA
ncbi:MAG: uroporphyrinogen-III synthase, partial [Caldilineaceae bacterium]|nr:uroporphyrinogen-III synthase [Caldilineaceae bacterium]